MSDRSKLRAKDIVSTSVVGLRSRRGRTVLTALGIAIGIASMVAVVGISSSSKAALLAQLDELGTNLLQVEASASGISIEPLPIDAEPMIRRVENVDAAAAVITTELEVRRNAQDTSLVGINTMAVSPELFETLRVDMAVGRPLDEGLRSLPVAVLGEAAATRLGITELNGGPTIDVGGHVVVVVGILGELPLHPDVSRKVLVGDEFAITTLGVPPNPTSIYVRIDPELITDTRPLLAPTANPGRPAKVDVSRPSDLLEARAEVDQNLQSLLLALGGVALLVGGVGIANVMVISVLERRGEIGLRRALGATRGHIRSQFVLEAALLSGLGGVLGIFLGSGITIVYARRQGWLADLPPIALLSGVGAALVIGMLAGLYPAAKAARLDPALAVSGGTG